MKRIALAMTAYFLLALSAAAQSTTVSGQVTDAGGQSWNNGTVTAQFVPNPLYPTLPQYSWTGGAFVLTVTGTMNGTGAYSISVPSSTAITPGNSFWQFQFCPLASSPCFTTTNVTVIGATQTVNATPPVIVVNSSPDATAYADAEIVGAMIGSIYYNTASNVLRICNGPAPCTWATVGGGGGGTVTSIAATSPIVATPNPITGAGTLSCPTCNTSSATIAGTIAVNQVAFGSGVNTISGSANLTYTSGVFNAQSSACPLTPFLTLTACGNNVGFGGGPLEIIQTSTTPPNGCGLVMSNSNSTGNTGSSRAIYTCFDQITVGGFAMGQVFPSGASGALNFVGTGASQGDMEIGTNLANGTDFVQFFTNNDGTSGLTSTNGGAVSFPPILNLLNTASISAILTFNGASSGHAAISVPAAAGTPCTILLPITSPTVGQVLSSAAPSGGTCQATWSTPSTVATAVPLSGITAATGSNTIANGNNPQTWNWALTTDAIDGMAFGETSAATNGTLTNGLANQALFTVATTTNSTAVPLEIVQGSITNTVSTPIAQFEATWNNAGLVGQGLLLNVTNIAFTAGSLLENLQVGNVSQWKVDKAGNVTAVGQFNCGLAGTTSCVINGAGSTSGAATITWPAVAGTATNPITSSNNWSAPVLVATANGAASAPSVSVTGTPFTGGTGTTTVPLAYLNSGTAPTAWSTSGTEFGINAPSGFAGNFLDFHLNGGSSLWSVSSTGQTTALGGTNSSRLTMSATGHLLISGAAPTISSGFGTAPSVTANNGTAAFRINVGTANTGNGIVSLPIAATGWNCYATDITTTSASVAQTKTTGSTTTTATLQNYTDLGATGGWVDSDVLAVSCFAF